MKKTTKKTITLHNEFHNTEAKIRVELAEYNDLVECGFSDRAIESEIWCQLEAREIADSAIRAKLNRLRNVLCPSRAGGCKCGGLYHS